MKQGRRGKRKDRKERGGEGRRLRRGLWYAWCALFCAGLGRSTGQSPERCFVRTNGSLLMQEWQLYDGDRCNLQAFARRRDHRVQSQWRTVFYVDPSKCIFMFMPRKKVAGDTAALPRLLHSYWYTRIAP